MLSRLASSWASFIEVTSVSTSRAKAEAAFAALVASLTTAFYVFKIDVQVYTFIDVVLLSKLGI